MGVCGYAEPCFRVKVLDNVSIVDFRVYAEWGTSPALHKQARPGRDLVAEFAPLGQGVGVVVGRGGCGATKFQPPTVQSGER